MIWLFHIYNLRSHLVTHRFQHIFQITYLILWQVANKDDSNCACILSLSSLTGCCFHQFFSTLIFHCTKCGGGEEAFSVQNAKCRVEVNTFIVCSAEVWRKLLLYEVQRKISLCFFQTWFFLHIHLFCESFIPHSKNLKA